MPSPRAVLLDLGGPVLNEDHEYAAWDDRLLDLLAQDGAEANPDEYRAALTQATRACHPQPRLIALWELVRPDVPRFRRVMEAFRAYTSRSERHLAGITLRPGARETIRSLARGCTLALAANQPSAVRTILQQEGVLECFRFQHVSEDLGVSKPDPLFFQIILDTLGLPAGSAVMVGDRLDADVLPAKVLGMKAIRVLQGPYAAQQPATPLHRPDAEVTSLDEMPKALCSLGC